MVCYVVLCCAVCIVLYCIVLVRLLDELSFQNTPNSTNVFISSVEKYLCFDVYSFFQINGICKISNNNLSIYCLIKRLSKLAKMFCVAVVVIVLIKEEKKTNALHHMNVGQCSHFQKHFTTELMVQL